MASIAIMIGGAILNATAFIGGSFNAKSLSTSEKSDAEKKRHDLALEKYNNDWATFQKKKKAFEDYRYEREKEKTNAQDDFQTTNEALRYYKATRPVSHGGESPTDTFTDSPPTFTNYYKPSAGQKKGELLYVGGGMLGIGYLASKFL